MGQKEQSDEEWSLYGQKTVRFLTHYSSSLHSSPSFIFILPLLLQGAVQGPTEAPLLCMHFFHLCFYTTYTVSQYLAIQTGPNSAQDNTIATRSLSECPNHRHLQRALGGCKLGMCQGKHSKGFE
jgi:hypothetical protein